MRVTGSVGCLACITVVTPRIHRNYTAKTYTADYTAASHCIARQSIHHAGHRTLQRRQSRRVSRTRCLQGNWSCSSHAAAMQQLVKPSRHSDIQHVAAKRRRMPQHVASARGCWVSCLTCGLMTAFRRGRTMSSQPLNIRRLEPAHPPTHQDTRLRLQMRRRSSPHRTPSAANEAPNVLAAIQATRPASRDRTVHHSSLSACLGSRGASVPLSRSISRSLRTGIIQGVLCSALYIVLYKIAP